MQKFKRPKLALIFGHYINKQEVEFVFETIRPEPKKNSPENDSSKNSSPENDSLENKIIIWEEKKGKRLNKRAVLALQLYFKYNYLPIFPEMFEYVLGRKGKEESKIIHFKYRRRWNEMGMHQYYADHTFKKYMAGLEMYLANSADLIVNFMETNSSSVELGIYLDKEKFKKTIIITPPENLVEKVMSGNFTKGIIRELSPSKSHDEKDSFYSRLSMYMDISKKEVSKNVSYYETSISSKNLNELIKKRLERRAQDFSTHVRFKYASFRDNFWNSFFHSIPNNIRDMRKLMMKKDNIQKNDKNISDITSFMESFFFSEEPKSSFSYKIINNLINENGTFIHKNIFNRTMFENIENSISYFIFISIFIESIFGIKRFPQSLPKKLENKSILSPSKNNAFYLKGKRKIFPQPIDMIELDSTNSKILNYFYKQKNIDCSFAYEAKKSTYDAAKKHLGSTHYLKLDIQEFYDSIDKEILVNYLLSERHFKEMVPKIQHIFQEVKGIKQGYILSPVISNIFMVNFDLNIMKECATRGLKYSRYSDDILISSKFTFDDNDVLEYVKKELHKIKLKINLKKTGVYKNICRFLGLTITNNQIKLSRSKKAEMIELTKNKKKLNERQKGILSYYLYIEKRIKEG